MATTRVGSYANELYKLAESVKATRILELGLGAAVSSLAFVDSLANRKPGHLITMEIMESTKPPMGAVESANLRGVGWMVIYKNPIDYSISGEFDLMYFDGPSSVDGIMASWKNLGACLRPGGLLIIDGYGSGAIEQGHPGPEDGIKLIAKEFGVNHDVIWYNEPIHGFGVVRKPVK